MNLTKPEDFLLHTAEATRSVAQLACYAVSLALGSNLLCRTLRADTIEKYLLAVSKYLQPIHATKRDPRMDRIGDKQLSPMIKSVINEQRRWESIPNQREPFLPELTRHLIQLIQTSNPPEDHLLRAALQWFIIGHHIGFRRSEVLQPPSHHNLSNPALHDDGRPTAFLRDDLSFTRASRQRLSHPEVLLLSPTNLESATFRWRSQKNKKNGEKKSLGQPRNGGALNGVHAAQQILSRHYRLIASHTNPKDVPLAIYKHDSGEIRYITSNDIAKIAQRLASEVYNITDPIELSRFSCHSIRVGAAVILHQQGFTPTQIKFLLRWESDAYLKYLRNILSLGIAHADAINFEETPLLPDIPL